MKLGLLGGKPGEDAKCHNKELGLFGKHMERIIRWAGIRNSLLKGVVKICALMGSIYHW